MRMPLAVRMIRIEHRDDLQVLECLCRLLDRLEERGGEKRRLLFLILDYVEAFPATFHHPKEEDYFFAALGRRRPDCGPLIERLPSYPPVGPTDRLHDLYGSLSTRLGMRRSPPRVMREGPARA